MWIHNCSKYKLALGRHPDPGPCSILIQIDDHDTRHVKPLREFASVHQYNFDDVASEVDDDVIAQLRPITHDQALGIVQILKYAQYTHSNVIVQCPVGLSRSGAVVEVAQLLGFEPTDAYKLPSLSVKYALLAHI